MGHLDKQNAIPLESINIPKPCRAEWDAMPGDDRVRFCQTCQKNVYNLSALSREQAEALVNDHEEKRCVRFYRRADGSVLTSDCSVGTRRTLERAWWGALLVALGGLLARPVHVLAKPAITKSSVKTPVKKRSADLKVRPQTKQATPRATPQTTPQPMSVIGAPCVPTPTPTGTSPGRMTAEMGDFAYVPAKPPKDN
jgi:hypothetical protein